MLPHPPEPGAVPPEIAASLREKLSPEELAALGIPAMESSPARGFILEPGAPLPAKLKDYYLHPLRDYEPVYDRGERAIKRWVSTGRHAKPPAPPPLDDPPRMAAWWRRHMGGMNPPEKLLDYERTAPPPAPEASSRQSAASTLGTDEKPRGKVIDLSEMFLGVDEEIRQCESLVAGHFARLEAASAAGDDDGVRRWTPIWQAGAEQLRKTRNAVIELKKKNGDLLPRAQLVTEIAQLLEALRLMRIAMADKILAELSKRATGRMRRVLRLLEPLLRESVAAVRSREDDILRNIEGLGSPRAAESAFALVAA